MPFSIRLKVIKLGVGETIVDVNEPIGFRVKLTTGVIVVGVGGVGGGWCWYWIAIVVVADGNFVVALLLFESPISDSFFFVRRQRFQNFVCIHFAFSNSCSFLHILIRGLPFSSIGGPVRFGYYIWEKV